MVLKEIIKKIDKNIYSINNKKVVTNDFLNKRVDFLISKINEESEDFK